MNFSYKTILFFALSILLFSGCFLQSVHPLVTEKESILVPALEGVWETKEARWTFIHDPKKFKDMDFGSLDFEIDDDEPLPDEKMYFGIYENLESDKADTTFAFITAGLFNDSYFLDIKAVEVSGSFSDNFESSFYFPVHLFTKVRVEDSTLTMELFKEDWIKEMIGENKVRIKHEKVDEKILLTAQTEELKKFITKYSEDERAFEKPSRFVRLR